MSVDNVLTNKGKLNSLAELEEYHKLGTPQELRESAMKQVKLIENIIKSYNSLKKRFNEVNDMFVEFQALIFIIIKDKLQIEGLITEGMNPIDQIALIKKEYDDKYINMNTSEMCDMMIKYVTKDFDKEE